METQFRRIEWRVAARSPHIAETTAQNQGPDRAAGAPSLRQYELDQVHRVTALRRPAPSVSQPLVGTPQVNAQTLRTANRFVNRVGKRAKAISTYLRDPVSFSTTCEISLFDMQRTVRTLVLMADIKPEQRASSKKRRRASKSGQDVGDRKTARRLASDNPLHCLNSGKRKSESLPTDDRDAILKLARILARQAAREDHTRQQSGSACNVETRRDLRKVFNRSAK